MATTIKVLTGSKWLLPSANPIIYVAHETVPSGKTFNISISMYIDGSPQVVSRLQYLFDQNGDVVLDVHKHIDSILQGDCPIERTNIIKPLNNLSSTLSIGWETKTGNTINASGNFAGMPFKARIPFDEFQDWDYSDYKCGIPTGPGKFLTNWDNSYKLSIDDKMWLSFYNWGGWDTVTDTKCKWLSIKTNTGVFRIHNDNCLAASVLQDRTVNVGVGPANLIEQTSTITVVSGSLPMFDSNTSSYTVKLVDDLFVNNSEIITINIEEKCSKYEKYQFVFRDDLSSYIPVNFNLVSKKDYNIKRKSYRTKVGSYDSGSSSWGYNVSDAGSKTYNVTSDEKITINSDWVTETAADMIEYMLFSEEVYHIDESGQARNIQILTSSYKKKKRVNEQLINFTIEFEYTNKYNKR